MGRVQMRNSIIYVYVAENQRNEHAIAYFQGIVEAAANRAAIHSLPETDHDSCIERNAPVSILVPIEPLPEFCDVRSHRVIGPMSQWVFVYGVDAGARKKVVNADIALHRVSECADFRRIQGAGCLTIMR